MLVFKHNSIFKQKDFTSVFDKYSGWYSEEEFVQILKLEKHRSNRTESPISHIVIDIRNLSDNSRNIPKQDYIKFLKNLIHLISINSRDFDVKYLSHSLKIGILLIHTDIIGAKSFIDRISKILYDNFKSSSKNGIFRTIDSVSIASYPLNKTGNCRKIEAKPVIVKNIQFEKQDVYKPPVPKETSKMMMHWDFKSSLNGTIALDPLFCWDIINKEQLTAVLLRVKRLIDIIGALTGIILFAPLMFLIALGVKLTSKGCILFRQVRYGYMGRSFKVLKFRTMYEKNDDTIHKEYVNKLINGNTRETNLGTKDKPLYKMKDDPRITRFGKFLRKTCLDELPQFFNVLSGSMSLVGPRPPVLYEVNNYKSWHYRRIIDVKPGITGLWQVNGRDTSSFDDMVRKDIYYVNNWSLLLDLKIILKTVKVLLSFNGN
jgi:lipopolysaccharide/colanic/teichoic acid biosynthesis glycosyltransferase